MAIRAFGVTRTNARGARHLGAGVRAAGGLLDCDLEATLAEVAGTEPLRSPSRLSGRTMRVPWRLATLR